MLQVNLGPYEVKKIPDGIISAAEPPIIQNLEVQCKIIKEALRYQSIAESFKTFGNIPMAIKMYDKSIQIRLSKPDYQYSKQLGLLLINTGVLYKDQDKLTKAVEYYEKAVQIMPLAFGQKHISYGSVLFNLGMSFKALGDPLKAVGFFQKAIEIFTQVFQEDNQMLLFAQIKFLQCFQELKNSIGQVLLK